MICHYNNGNYKEHGDIITPMQIESPGIQRMSFSRTEQNYDGKLIIQFNNIENTIEINQLIEIDRIPTHNIV